VHDKVQDERVQGERGQLDRPRTARRRATQLALSLAAVAAAAHASNFPVVLRHPPYSPGQQVTVQGVVTDSKANHLAGLRVTLEASQQNFSLYPWGLQKKQVVTGSAETTAQGDFGLQFPWNQWYNHFELAVTVPVGIAGGEDTHVLWHEDITRRVAQGSPVVVPVTLEDKQAAFLDTFRTFLASLGTDEERRFYHESGRPDQVDHNSFPDHVETAWWYFRAGKVVRFRDGHVEKVETFAPVEPLE
jgi:hypothetical protein